MNFKPFVWIVFLIILASGAWITGSSVWHGREGGSGDRLNTYARVMQTQTIRCGYVVWPPYIIKDPKTGILSGLFFDYMEELGAALHLKIDWAEESGTGTFPTALESGRIDAECASVWPSAARARVVDFTVPIYFVTHDIYVRADDFRFDGHLEKLDSPSVMIATIDGETGSLIAARDFPKAATMQLPELSSQSEPFIAVVTGKADAYIADGETAARFASQNPGKIRKVKTKTPLRVFGNTIAVARGQEMFRRMLDAATQELLNSGRIERLLMKYERHPGALLRVAPAYRAGASF